MAIRSGAWIAAALIALGGAVAAGCGSPPTTAQQTQTAAAATPGTAPTAQATPLAATSMAATSPIAAPPAGTVIPGTPVSVMPITAGAPGARTDCPAGTATYRDTSGVISICAPSALEVLSWVDVVGAPGIYAHTAGVAANPAVVFSVQVTPRGTFPDPAKLAGLCRSGLVRAQTSAEELYTTVAGLSAIGCHVVGEPEAAAGPLELMNLTAPLAPASAPRYVNVLATWRTQSAGAKALIDQLLASVALRP